MAWRHRVVTFLLVPNSCLQVCSQCWAPVLQLASHVRRGINSCLLGECLQPCSMEQLLAKTCCAAPVVYLSSLSCTYMFGVIFPPLLKRGLNIKLYANSLNNFVFWQSASGDLMIRNIQLKHSGKYVCMVKTEVDSVASAADLIVRGKFQLQLPWIVFLLLCAVDCRNSWWCRLQNLFIYDLCDSALKLGSVLDETCFFPEKNY